ncbi:MAG: Hsp70 family protein [Actinophytocola sp.]|uniref:Hsp70 family protein n=1 Tax=Actinophytocola sp. TaxID=1872138 RepID=UPI003C78DE7F
MAQVTATVDFGTSHTVAVVSGPGLPARLVTVDGQPWFPSAVFWTSRGDAVVGGDAMRLARTEPARLEPRPKSRIAEPDVLLGDAVVPTATLVRAVLAKVVGAATETAGAPVQHLVLTHPANWGSTRIGALLSAAQGLAPRQSTVSEPVAAATWFAKRHEFPVGASIGVLDFGGGTCDAAVVRREGTGLSVTGCAGLPDLGGDDLDQRIVDAIRAAEPSVAELLDDQQRAHPDRMAALLRFRDDVRAAKEVLSRHPQVEIALPGDRPDRLLTRIEFERLVSADLARAVTLLTEVVAGCGLRPADLHAVHLVGGAGQIPLLGTLLGHAVGVRIGLDEAPQSVVALGGQALTVSDETAPPVTTPVAETPTASHDPIPFPTGPVAVATRTPPGARRRPWVAVAVATVAVLVAVTATALGGDRTVSGEARAVASGAAPLSVPPPADGRPIAIPGQSTQHLPVVEKGTTVEYESGGAAMTWRLDAFVDTAEQSAELEEAGVRVDDAHRLVLVRITVGAVDKEASPSTVEADTHLVDDRGLMVSSTENFRLRGCQERAGEQLDKGEERQTCLAFRVGRTAPVTEVALTGVSTRRPGVVPQDQLTAGARVRVTGSRVDGTAQPLPRGALPLLVPHTFAGSDNIPAAEVAVADLVPEPSAYFDAEPIGLPGSRGVLVRVAVRMAEAGEVMPSLQVQLQDDRGTAIDGSDSTTVTTEGCTAQHEIAKSTDLRLWCVLFAVPTATPVRNVAISEYGPGEVLWAAS